MSMSMKALSMSFAGSRELILLVIMLRNSAPAALSQQLTERPRRRANGEANGDWRTVEVDGAVGVLVHAAHHLLHVRLRRVREAQRLHRGLQLVRVNVAGAVRVKGVKDFAQLLRSGSADQIGSER